MANSEILVLDDEENYAAMLQGLLEQNGYTVDMATEPEKALESIEEKRYRLVISDYKMPVMDGAVFLKKTRELRPQIPIMLVSGLMNTPELIKVANMGVTLVIEKPINTEFFLEQVARFVKPGETSTEPEEVEAKAEEAEAPEYSYTQPAHYLAEQSRLGQDLLQRLWEANEQANRLFLMGPEGAEYDLAVQEVAAWKYAGGKPVLECLIAELLEAEVQEQLREVMTGGEHAPVLVIEGLLEATSEVQNGALAVTRDPRFSIWSFVFTLPGEPSEADLMERLHPDVFSATRGQIVRFPPLVDRPGDVADYALRLLDEQSRNAHLESLPDIDPDAVHGLLQRNWSQNYIELEGTISDLVREVASSHEAIDMSTLERIIVRRTGTVTDKEPVVESLNQVLRRQQQRILRREAERGDQSIEQVLEALNILGEGENGEERLGQLPLVYPDLARAD